MPCQPKQLTQYRAEDLAELQGDVSQQAIRYFLDLIPPFSDGDVIHDNACGAGAVTETIMESNPPNIKMEATDINPAFVEGVTKLAEAKKWPVTTGTMPAQKLTFPDNTFTHSIASFAFHCIGDHISAAKEVYRTLAPGKIAVGSVWSFMPHIDVLRATHTELRGNDAPLPTLLEEDDFNENKLRAALEAGGFKTENISFSEKECRLVCSDLKRWAQLAWSYLGAPPSGWTQDDEDQWDQAVYSVAEKMQASSAANNNEKGEMVMRFVALVAISKK